MNEFQVKIEKYGVSNMASDLDVSRQVVHGWKKRGYVPLPWLMVVSSKLNIRISTMLEDISNVGRSDKRAEGVAVPDVVEKSGELL